MQHMPDAAVRPPVLLFMYLGRFGALGRFTLELAEAAAETAEIEAHFLASANNDLVKVAASSGIAVRTLDTFARPTPLALIAGYRRARSQFLAQLDAVQPMAVVNLMAHVWSPFLTRAAQARGVRVLTIVHDAVPHPGDPTARLNRWLLREARHADRIVTLSRSVARSLMEQGYGAQCGIDVLFHPDLRFATPSLARKWTGDHPLRVLFLGRIMAYKGLDLLVEAVEDLRSQGRTVELGVAGSGDICMRTRNALDRVGAEVINRWIDDDEITPLLARYDAVACAHVEASQSGIAATAFAHAMPVIAMPTGGIVEQVIDGETGVLAAQVSREALGAAIARLSDSPELYNAISAKLAASASTRSMDAFLRSICHAAVR